MDHSDEYYMGEALRLASLGYGFTSTNPMVGALIVAPGGRIIGRGWHRRFGAAHAEVNAVRSVREEDRPLLPKSTIYVTLEPCSHYGKTPPCARLLIEENIPRIVVGAPDPFPEVAGRGIRMLRNAGREVIEGVLKDECREINLPFMTAHEKKRPFIMLKWAESADGYIAGDASRPVVSRPPTQFSGPLGRLLLHHLRAGFNAVMVGVNTVIADDPQLNCRMWPAGFTTRPVVRMSDRIPAGARILGNKPIFRNREEKLPDFLRRLYEKDKVISLLVEGGTTVLQEFIDSGLFDSLRIETSPRLLGKGIKAPSYDPSALILHKISSLGDNSLRIFRK